MHIIGENDDSLAAQTGGFAGGQEALVLQASLARPSKPKSLAGNKGARPVALRRRKKETTRQRQRRRAMELRQAREARQIRPEMLVVPEGNLTVQELADKLSVESSEIIKSLFFKGIIATVTQTLDLESIEKVSQEFGVPVLQDDIEEAAANAVESSRSLGEQREDDQFPSKGCRCRSEVSIRSGVRKGIIGTQPWRLFHGHGVTKQIPHSTSTTATATTSGTSVAKSGRKSPPIPPKPTRSGRSSPATPPPTEEEEKSKSKSTSSAVDSSDVSSSADEGSHSSSMSGRSRRNRNWRRRIIRKRLKTASCRHLRRKFN